MVDFNSYEVRGFPHYTFCLKVTPQEETIYDHRFSLEMRPFYYSNRLKDPIVVLVLYL